MDPLITSGAATDVGKQREGNEDAFLVRPPLFAVADGMGGARAGEVASRLAVDTLAEQLDEADGEPAEVATRLLAAAQEANRRIFAAAEEDSARRGMGTTLTALVVCGRLAQVVHIGDSRLYLLRGGVLEQITEDHSLVAAMVREGRLSPAAAASHPYRSVLSRAMGTEAEVEIDALELELQGGDALLLCSDGLSGPVPADRLRKMLGGRDPQKAARRLIDEALRRGGPDNVTAVVIRVWPAAGEGGEPPAPAAATDDPDDDPDADGDAAPPRRGFWRRWTGR